jgi:hypothetical protein
MSNVTCLDLSPSSALGLLVALSFVDFANSAYDWSHAR